MGSLFSKTNTNNNTNKPTTNTNTPNNNSTSTTTKTTTTTPTTNNNNSTDYSTACPKQGYYKKSDIVTASSQEQMLSNLLSMISSLGGEKEDDKKQVINLMFNYRPFATPPAINSVDDAIETLLSQIMQIPEACINSTIEAMSSSYNLKTNTSFNGDNCSNNVNDSNAYFNTISILIKGVYEFVAGALLYMYWSDCNKADGDSTKIFGAFAKDDASKNKILKENIQNTLKDLWYRLFITFWFPRILDVNVSMDSKLKSKILLYITSNNADVSKANPGILMCKEDNVKCLLQFLVLFDMVQNKDAKDNAENRCSDCYIGKYLVGKGEFKKLKEYTQQGLKGCLGLLFDSDGKTDKDPEWNLNSIQPDKMLEVISKIDTDVFKDSKNVLKYERNKFTPIGLNKCNRWCDNSFIRLVICFVVFLLIYLFVQWFVKKYISNNENDEYGYGLA